MLAGRRRTLGTPSGKQQGVTRVGTPIANAAAKVITPDERVSGFAWWPDENGGK